MASKLGATQRTEKGKYEVNTLREEGRVPGNLYGKGQANVNISFLRKDLESVIVKGDAEIDLELEGKVIPAKIVQVQYFPTGTFPSHVDLLYR